jgi:hypothetical protein
MEDKNQFKIKMDLTTGAFEAEGSEEFVKSSLANFKEIIVNRTSNPAPTLAETINKNNGGIKKRAVKSSAMPTLIKDLNLKPQGIQSLNEFYNLKAPKSNIESNVVFVYYLQRILYLTGITMDHIYTCYKWVGGKVPENLRQSIADTAAGSKYGLLDASNMQDIKLSMRGENTVETELPKIRK